MLFFQSLVAWHLVNEAFSIFVSMIAVDSSHWRCTVSVPIHSSVNCLSARNPNISFVDLEINFLPAFFPSSSHSSHSAYRHRRWRRARVSPVADVVGNVAMGLKLCKFNWVAVFFRGLTTFSRLQTGKNTRLDAAIDHKYHLSSIILFVTTTTATQQCRTIAKCDSAFTKGHVRFRSRHRNRKFWFADNA